jgi:transcriptional regulator with XRE-family HTH domain
VERGTVDDPRSFGDALRRERERRGITLDAIAEQTKVSVALLDGLERGDLSRWPSGIFRRAFVRGYAQAVGLDATNVVDAFTRLYPEVGGPPAPARHVVAAALGQADPLRLTLAEDGPAVWGRAARRHVLGAVVDLGAVVITWIAAARLAGVDVAWLVTALVAVGYHLAGVLLLGTSAGVWFVSTWRPAQARAADAEAEQGGADGAGVDEPRPGADVVPRSRRRDRRPPARVERYPRRPTDSRGARR